MRVPLLDLKAQYAKHKPALDEAALRVLASGRHVMGPELEAFEKELAAHLHLPHAVSVSSGTDALLSAAMAVGIPAGSEVVTTAFSFFATPETAVRLGAKPVFADVSPGSFNVNIDDMLNKISKKTSALIPVHLFGEQLDMTRLAATGIPVIEDAAQTLSPGIAQKTACATLSFFPSKNLGAAGDGGAVVTTNPELADKLSIMRQHGSRPKYIHHIWGGNFRMDPMQAAILRVKLKHLDAWNAQRRKNALRYIERLAGTPLLLPQDCPGHVWHHFVVRGPKREELRKHLASLEIDSEVYYPLALHQQPCFAQYGYKAGDCPNAEAACAEALALPVHPDLSDDQIDFVAETVTRFYGA